ncbi:hypothetical protein DPMN_111495 [Dreissena polymorpha]|uniref:Uncharacterized protein n=1 Tax=Dreissena polymorpha TaxID=45954 RepID=A0A9D4KEM7_DREPO|nr:hypothetical protein DPMN_111495 [Dreissena polymorpha]
MSCLEDLTKWMLMQLGDGRSQSGRKCCVPATSIRPTPRRQSSRVPLWRRTSIGLGLHSLSQRRDTRITRNIF